MTRKNSQLFILVFLGMLTAFGPFVTDMYLPTLPAMTGFFHTTSSQVQLGLTASMIGLAVGQLLFGPLSDKMGRRPPLIAAKIVPAAGGSYDLRLPADTYCFALAGGAEKPPPKLAAAKLFGKRYIT